MIGYIKLNTLLITDQGIAGYKQHIASNTINAKNWGAEILDNAEEYNSSIVEIEVLERWDNTLNSIKLLTIQNNGDWLSGEDAMDRFMYGGVSVNTEVGTARTEYAGAKLRDKISQISPDQYEEEMSGLKDPILNDMLIEKNIIQEGEIVSYERGKDFALNLEHHMRAGDLLTYPEYQILVDRHYTGNRQAQDIYKTKESFENYVIQHEALNK